MFKLKICKKRQRTKKKGVLQDTKPKTLEEFKAEEVIISQYQKDFPYEVRLKESIECKQKHSDCVPLIIERYFDHKDIKALETPKFLFHAQAETAQAMVRTQKDVQAKKMWFYVHMPNNKIKYIYPQSKLGVLYQRYCRSDGNLYIFYSDKNLIDTSSTFMNVMQYVCIVLVIIYAYLYFFGAHDLLTFLGYDVNQIAQQHLQAQANSTSTNPESNPTVGGSGQDKIEL